MTITNATQTPATGTYRVAPVEISDRLDLSRYASPLSALQEKGGDDLPPEGKIIYHIIHDRGGWAPHAPWGMRFGQELRVPARVGSTWELVAVPWAAVQSYRDGRYATPWWLDLSEVAAFLAHIDLDGWWEQPDRAPGVRSVQDRRGDWRPAWPTYRDEDPDDWPGGIAPVPPA